MKTGKKLQVFLDNEWKYVFCRDPLKRLPITTKDPKKALTAKYNDDNRLLNYFQESFGSLQFRLI